MIMQKGFNMKKIISLLLAVILVMGLAACAKNENTEITSNEDISNAKELKKITFALDWTPNTNHTGLYVAKEKGYFEEAGLDVDIVFIDGTGAATLCATKKAEFAIEAQDTLAAAFIGEEPLGITAVAAILQHNTSGIISRKGEGLDTPKGLEGHMYSTWDSPIEKAMLKQLVEKDGGSFDNVKLIPNTVTDEPGALSAKQTDAIWVFYGWSCINAEVQGFEYDYYHFKDIDPVFDYYTPVIIANNDYLSENPEDAKAFLSAARKGYEFAAANPEEAAQILIDGDTTGSLKGSEELVKKSQAWISTQYIDDAQSWGVIDGARWNGFYNWLNENNLVETPLAENTGFTNEYLK